SLAILPTACIARLTQAGLIEVFTKDYIYAVKARGFSRMHIAMRYGLKGALFPVIAYLGPAFVHLLTGSLIVEKIFSIPGLGQSMVASLAARDYPVILGLTLFSSSFLMFSSFIVELISSYLDPR
ncbi:MAG: ABC transporter permease, partial [Chlamydiae bacterium]|nr:ABC transporter permease [Chlamydiota bacterium]